MGFLKFIVGCLCIGCGIYIGQKGFYSPNSAAAHLEFGVAFLIAMVGFIIWSN